MITDFGNIEKGSMVYVPRIYESCNTHDIEVYRGKDQKLHMRRVFEPGEICEIIHLRPSGAHSIDVTFKSASGHIFTQLKRIWTKVEVL